MRSRIQFLVNTFTGMRIVITAGLAWSVTVGFVPFIILLSLFILADYADGIIARRFGCDTAFRRILDATIDRVSIHFVYAFALFSRTEYLPFYWPLLARDIVVFLGYLFAIRPLGWLIIGRRYHKLSSLGAAALGLTIVAEADALIPWVAIFVLSANYILLIDYIGVYLAYRPTGRSTTKDILIFQTQGWQGLTAIFNGRAKTNA